LPRRARRWIGSECTASNSSRPTLMRSTK
jgi:hypothetical protein